MNANSRKIKYNYCKQTFHPFGLLQCYTEARLGEMSVYNNYILSFWSSRSSFILIFYSHKRPVSCGSSR